jgi:hypothetical protein
MTAMSGLIDKIAVLGREFTIQTEYVPQPRRKVRTLVYDQGRLVTSREIVIGPTVVTDAAVDAKVKEQHARITETLITRAAELGKARTTAAPPAETATQRTQEPPKPSKGTPRPDVEPGSRLASAIAVRQTIGPFGTAFARPMPGTAEGLVQTLEAVEAAIDAIRDAPTYDAIRLDEQLTLIALKSELETWHLADRDLGKAAEIWPNVESFALHLQKINHRGDLVAFDHQALTWAMSELGKGRITDRMVETLGGLGGRDTELDGFLRNPDGVEPMALLEILLRLMDQTLA